MKLSIGQAWDEAKAVLRADGGAIMAVALALSVLPGAILETLSPSAMRTSDSPWYVAVLGLVVALLSLAGQLAISRIALGPSTTVGAAIGLGFRRVPALFGALFLMFLPFALIAGLLLYSVGGFTDDATKVAANNVLPALFFLAIGTLLLIRLLFLTPLAADQDLNSIQLVKTGWRLTSGHFLKLLLLVLLLGIVALVIIGALGGALGAVALLVLGPVEPGNTSALLVALIQQVLAAVVSVLFVVVVCRLYRQATTGAVSVPHAGHD